jgi:hypothetical protein
MRSSRQRLIRGATCLGAGKVRAGLPTLGSRGLLFGKVRVQSVSVQKWTFLVVTWWGIADPVLFSWSQALAIALERGRGDEDVHTRRPSWMPDRTASSILRFVSRSIGHMRYAGSLKEFK